MVIKGLRRHSIITISHLNLGYRHVRKQKPLWIHFSCLGANESKRFTGDTTTRKPPKSGMAFQLELCNALLITPNFSLVLLSAGGFVTTGSIRLWAPDEIIDRCCPDSSRHPAKRSGFDTGILKEFSMCGHKSDYQPKSETISELCGAI